MSVTISSSAVRQILSLTEVRDSLVAKLAKIDAQIEAALKDGFSPSAAPKARRGRKPKPTGRATRSAGPRQARKGKTKNLIISVLQKAGEAGIAVADLAEKTGLKVPNVRAWFSITGKGIKEIEKIGPGTYRFITGEEKTPATETPTAPRPKAKRKKRK